LLLEHLQRGSWRAPEAGWLSLTTKAGAFGSLGRREQFERLAGVVDLLGAGAGLVGEARGRSPPVLLPLRPDVGCGAEEFLKRLQSWPRYPI
jgi:hypothetical protein